MPDQIPSGPEASVVICTVDRSEQIARAVRSVLDGNHRDLELVVIDQSADERTKDACAEFAGDGRFRYVHSDVRGLSAAYNRGIRETSGAIVAFTDDDCLAHPDWLASVLEVFAGHADVDMLYGQTLIPAEGAPPGIIPELKFATPRIIGRGHEFEINGMGANYALRRSLIERIGGFDEVLGGGGPLRSSQDFDFQYRAYAAGALVRFSPEPKVDHYGAREPGEQWERTLHAYGVGDGGFYWKHVRCGDLRALRLFAQRLAWFSLRELLNPLRRKPSSRAYLTACITGARESRRFRIDRSKRVYVPATAAAS